MLTLSNVSLRFGGGESPVILDRGSGLFTEDNVRSMTWGEVGVQTAAIVSEMEYPSG